MRDWGRLPLGMWIAFLALAHCAIRCTAQYYEDYMENMVPPPPDLTSEILNGLRSNHECNPDIGVEEFVVCRYYNLVLYGGKTYYIADDASTVSLPPVLASLRSDDPVIWITPEIVTPGEFPWDWQSDELQSISDAVLNYFPSSPDIFKMAGEYVPSLHNVLCGHLGRCYNQDADVCTLFSLAPAFNFSEVDPLVRDMLRSLSSSPPIWALDPQVQRRVVVMERAMVGYGHTCMAQQNQCSGTPGLGYGRAPMIENVMFALRVRMMQAQRLNIEEPVLVQPPRVLVVDREYGAGRQFLNSAEMMHELYHRWYRSVEVVYLRLQGMDLAEVADAVFRSAVVVLTYGEALPLMLPYLKHGAVVVHVAEQPWHDDLHAYARAWIDGLSPLGGMSLVEVTNTYPENIIIDLERLSTHNWWPLLSTKDKLNLIENKVCPQGTFQLVDPVTGQPLTGQLVDVHDRCMYDVMHGGCNLVFDLQQLEEALETAFFHLHNRFDIPQGMHFPFPLGDMADAQAAEAQAASGEGAGAQFRRTGGGRLRLR